jgi:DNA-binding NarL/FixJ family response regulator
MNGIEAARQIRQQSPIPRILCCSENLSPDVAESALQAGAGGYLVKSDAGRDLLSAVALVILGKCFVSRALAGQVFAKAPDSGLGRNQGHVVQFYVDEDVLLANLRPCFEALSARDNRSLQ